MTKEEIKDYALKYKRNQKIIAALVLLVVIIVAALLIFISVALLINDQGLFSIIIASVLSLISLLDLFLGIRFLIFARKKIKYTKDIECARNYCRIHGIVPDEKK